MKRPEIERLLPGIFQRASVYDPVTLKGNPLYALLEVMAGLHEPDEQVLRSLATYFNPYLADPHFIPYLASWVDLAPLLQSPATGEVLRSLPIDTGRLRELIASAAFLSQWRGTARALIFFLETATGVKGFTVQERVLDGDDMPIPFHIRVQCPKEAVSYRNLVTRIVELEKPAYVTYEVLWE
jgi:hypothetical protein